VIEKSKRPLAGVFGGGKWTHFSAYLIRKTNHIDEIETLLLRIADPKGNKVKGKLKGSRNLRPKLKVLLSQDFKRSMEEMFGGKKGKKKVAKAVKKKGKVENAENDNPLKGLLRHGQGIYANYKGKSYRAVFYKTRGIKLNGKFYETPTGAAKAIVDRGTVNGWRFWKYRDEGGELVSLGNLR